MNVEKAVAAAAEGEHGNIRFGAKLSGGKQRGIRAAGNVQHTVGIGVGHGAELFLDFAAVIQAGFEKDQLRIKPAMANIQAQLLLHDLVVGSLGRTEKDRALRTEYLRGQNIFNGPLIIQFDQCFHLSPPAVL